MTCRSCRRCTLTICQNLMLVMLGLRKDRRPHGPSPASSTLGRWTRVEAGKDLEHLKLWSHSLQQTPLECVHPAGTKQHIHIAELLDVSKYTAVSPLISIWRLSTQFVMIANSRLLTQCPCISKKCHSFCEAHVSKDATLPYCVLTLLNHGLQPFDVVFGDALVHPDAFIASFILVHRTVHVITYPIRGHTCMIPSSFGSLDDTEVIKTTHYRDVSSDMLKLFKDLQSCISTLPLVPYTIISLAVYQQRRG